jgi:hypothetical protein
MALESPRIPRRIIFRGCRGLSGEEALFFYVPACLFAAASLGEDIQSDYYKCSESAAKLGSGRNDFVLPSSGLWKRHTQ